MSVGRIIFVPIWDTRLYIYYGPFAAFVKWLRKNGFDDTRFIEENEPSGCRIATTYSKKDGRQIIYSRDPMYNPSLVHELSHAVHGILRARDVADEEAFAYTMEYLYTEATK